MKITEIASLTFSAVGVRRIKDYIANSVLLTSVIEWKVDQSKTKNLFRIIFILSSVLLILLINHMRYRYHSLAPGKPFSFGDFLAFWSYQEIARTHSAAGLYDIAATYQRQLDLGMDPDPKMPFPYPPSFLLLIWPLGLLPYSIGYILWLPGTLSLFVCSIFKTCSRLPFALGCAVVAPACAYTIYYAQGGFLTGALLTAGILLAQTRPIVSGLLIGILSVKPQLGLLVPVALAAAGLWRTFTVACATVAGLVIIAAMAFGPEAWVAWISGLPEYSEWFRTPSSGMVFRISVTDILRMSGFGSNAVIAAQAFVSTAVALLTWVSFRRGCTRLSCAALLTGAILASPHALIYDAPMVVASMIIFVQARIETTSTFNIFEILILLAAFVSPILLIFVNTAAVPATIFFAFMALYILIIRSDLVLKYKGFADGPAPVFMNTD